MENPFLSISWLKEFGKGLIHVNGSSTDKITRQELVNSKCCKFFNNKFNHKLFLNSVKIDNINNNAVLLKENIAIYYITFDEIKIKGDIIIPPNVLEKDYNVYAIYSYHKKTVNKDEIVSTEECKVDSIHMAFEKNTDSTSKNYYADASFSYRGTKRTATLKVIQQPNVLLDWKEDGRKLKGFKLTSDKLTFKREGGQATLKATAYYDILYSQRDTCGDVIAYSSSTEVAEDVTKDVTFKMLNYDFSYLNGNIITISLLEELDKEREVTVACEYKGKKSHVTLKQSVGGELHYKYSLSFLDTLKSAKEYLFNDSLEHIINVKVNSYQEMYINDEPINKVFNPFSVASECDWIKVIDKGQGNLLIDVLDNNLKENRFGSVLISNGSDNLEIKIIQPFVKLVKDTDYRVEVNYPYEVIATKIEDFSLEIIPYAIRKFENGNIEEENRLRNNDIITCQITNNDDKVKVEVSQVEFNKKFVAKLSLLTYEFKEAEIVGVVCINNKPLKKISFNLINDTYKEKIELEITAVAKNDSKENIVLRNNKLVINNIDSYEMQNVWLNEYCDEDKIFSEKIMFNVGDAYTFTTIMDEKKQSEETYTIEEDDLGIDLEIDV